MTDRTPEQPPQAKQQAKDKGPRTIQEALREAVQRLPHDQQKKVRAILRDKGVLKDEHGKE
jgi:hypothetical protein